MFHGNFRFRAMLSNKIPDGIRFNQRACVWRDLRHLTLDMAPRTYSGAKRLCVPLTPQNKLSRLGSILSKRFTNFEVGRYAHNFWDTFKQQVGRPEKGATAAQFIGRTRERLARMLGIGHTHLQECKNAYGLLEEYDPPFTEYTELKETYFNGKGPRGRPNKGGTVPCFFGRQIERRAPIGTIGTNIYSMWNLCRS